jgi:hypothetical protein
LNGVYKTGIEHILTRNISDLSKRLEHKIRLVSVIEKEQGEYKKRMKLLRQGECKQNNTSSCDIASPSTAHVSDNSPSLNVAAPPAEQRLLPLRYDEKAIHYVRFVLLSLTPRLDAIRSKLEKVIEAEEGESTG